MPSLAVLSFIPSLVAASWQISNVAQLDSGLVIRGHESTWQKGVSEYLGIPYAQPPVGPLRWRPAEPYKASPGTPLVANKFSPDCPANVAGFSNATSLNSVKGVVLASLGQYGDQYDEDCLSINVWTKPQDGGPVKAVLVWIYGGGFALGSTASPSYNGARLAAQEDVVVVSMNYRLNIFGFPSAPGLLDQNLGLLDQRLAIEWIRDNIVAFGGDPKRITLFGESAGGASVDMYSYAWVKDPIVNAFVPESGTASLGGSLGGNKTAGWYKASQKLGCGGAEAGEKTVGCMRTKPWTEVLGSIKPQGSQASLGGMGDFGPTPDGKVVFDDYKARAAAGNFIKRPMLVGNNANEIALFMVILNQVSALGSPLLSMANGVFSCPSGAAAQARTNARIKAYRYLYAGEWPNQDIAPKVGAWHGSEVGMVFGTVEYQQQFFGSMIGQKISFPNTDAQKVLEKKMMGAWAAFAKDPVSGLEKLGWPTYDERKPGTIVQLGGPNSGNITFVDSAVIDKSCGTLNSMMGASGGAGGLSGLSGLLGGLGKAPGGSGLPTGTGGTAPPPIPAPGSGTSKRGLVRK
ncbi:hypothetical protein E2P81_ATG01804 [Venturia nashicola]|uniref:Carboxylic ester hydrolase n=1 Tax=Venturia nashicola TaxID=86259 RepID=A0A4Z1PBW0_9PEZI|nr:hypothetical protein E6O75_ATG01850 [Venturia nashicola]TLD35501.1 hypothetical protein E2P81_ATG01804 [Venturia nashicola]